MKNANKNCSIYREKKEERGGGGGGGGVGPPVLGSSGSSALGPSDPSSTWPVG